MRAAAARVTSLSMSTIVGLSLLSGGSGSFSFPAVCEPVGSAGCPVLIDEHIG